MNGLKIQLNEKTLNVTMTFKMTRTFRDRARRMTTLNHLGLKHDIMANLFVQNDTDLN